MPTYTLCDPQVSSKGPIVPVTIDITKIGKRDSIRNGKSIPKPISVFALLDTGTTITMISSRVVKELNLEPIRSAKLRTFTELLGRQAYAIKLDMSQTFGETVIFDDILAIGDTFKKDKPPDAIEDCLIGIDILSEMVFVYIGPMDTFSLSY